MSQYGRCINIADVLIFHKCLNIENLGGIIQLSLSMIFSYVLIRVYGQVLTTNDCCDSVGVTLGLITQFGFESFVVLNSAAVLAIKRIKEIL